MSSYKKTVATLAVFGLASAAPTTSWGGSFSVSQVANPSFDGGHTVAVLMAKIFSKYNKPMPPALAKTMANLFDNASQALSKRGASGSATTTPLSGDSEWLTPVQIGNPPQTVNLDFDSGSSDLWVFSSETPTTASNGHKLYNISKSNSASQIKGYTWKVSYGDGSSASGNVYKDTVTVGGIAVSGQIVESATQASDEFAQDSSDGLLGLAFSKINQVSPKSQNTWFDNVKKSLTSPLWTADLKHGKAGKYTFGTIDKTAYTGNLSYSPVDSSNGFWSFTASGYGWGKNYTNSQFTGIADTGTTLTLLPNQIVQAYYGQIPGSQFSASDNAWYFPCNANVPDFSFGVGTGVNLTKIVIPAAYVKFDQEGNTCYGGIQPNTGIGFSIFGDTALKAAFVVFDSNGPRIGWANKKLT